MMRMIASANIALGLMTSSAKKRLCGGALGAPSTTSSMVSCGNVIAARSCASERNARIEPGVEEVDHEIDQHEDEGADDDHRLHDRIVASQHRLHREEPDAGPREHRFHDDGAAEEVSELEANDRHHRQQRVLERM